MSHHIAFLTYDWNSEIGGQFSQGIHRFIDEHPDVNVHIFTGFGSYRIDDQERAALQIFNLPYLSSYDGVILQGNRVWELKKRELLVERAASSEVPVVSMNYPLEGAVTVGTDNYQAAYEMTEHLLKDHHCKTMAVIAGLPSSEEAQIRKKASLDCADAYGIKNVKVYGNDWEEESGEEAVRQILADGEMPEALICGNDNLAFGAEQELIRHHFRIPEDVKVTGFDNLSYAVAAPVRISTIGRNFPGMVYTALDVMETLISGQKVLGPVYTPSQMVYSCSCGCGSPYNEIEIVKKKYLRANRYVSDYYHLYNTLSVSLDKARNLSDIARIMEANAAGFQSGAIYLVINGLYVENFGNTNPVRHYGDSMVLIGMSEPDGMLCDEKHVYASFSRKQLLPSEILQKKKLLQVYSLQAEETCIGYVVTDGIASQMEFNFLETAFSLLDNAIERVRRAYVMESLNNRLSTLYITDPLTGLYNRFGLEQRGRLLYDRLMKEGREAYICFIDVDNLKKINDVYGHESGDDAIVKISQGIIRGLDGTNAFAMRYGGDEFVVISEDSMIGHLQKELNYFVEDASHYPYKLSASAGEAVIRKEDSLALQEAIERADDTMYNTKKKKKYSI